MTVTRFPITNVPRPGWLGVCPECGGALAFLANNFAFCREGHTFKVIENDGVFVELYPVELTDRELRGW